MPIDDSPFSAHHSFIGFPGDPGLRGPMVLGGAERPTAEIPALSPAPAADEGVRKLIRNIFTV
jgi:hypothetical protein